MTLLSETGLSERAKRPLFDRGIYTVNDLRTYLERLPCPTAPHKYVSGWGRKTTNEIVRLLESVEDNRFDKPENASQSYCPHCGKSLKINVVSGG